MGTISYLNCFDTGRKSYCHLIEKDGTFAVLKEGDRSGFDDPEMYTIPRDVYCFSDKVKHIPVPERHDFEKKRLLMLHKEGFPVPQVLRSDLKGKVLMSFVDGILLSEKDDISEDAPKCAYLLGELHKKYDTYHGDPNLTNIIINGKVTFIDFETDFYRGVTLTHKQARDYRIFLATVYHRTKEKHGVDCVLSCTDAYKESATVQKENEVRMYMIKKLNEVRNPKLLNRYDDLGFGNPLHLKDLLHGI